MSSKQKLRYALIVTPAVIFAAAFMLPVLVTMTNSFMSGLEIQSRYDINVLPTNIFHILDAFPQIHFVRMTILPTRATLQQYFLLLRDVGYMRGFWNSVLITAPSVLGQIVVAVPAAYAFEMSQWRHKEKLFFVYVLIMLMPLPVILVPQFVMAGFMGISNSTSAIVLPAVFNPFGVFLLRQFMKNMPRDVVEAATLDGAGLLRVIVHMVVPLMKPAVAALALLVFVDFWNVVDQAIVFIPDPARLPLSVALADMITNVEMVFAASFFYMIPALLVFLYGQEYLIDGLRISSMK